MLQSTASNYALDFCQTLLMKIPHFHHYLSHEIARCIMSFEKSSEQCFTTIDVTVTRSFETTFHLSDRLNNVPSPYMPGGAWDRARCCVIEYFTLREGITIILHLPLGLNILISLTWTNASISSPAQAPPLDAQQESVRSGCWKSNTEEYPGCAEMEILLWKFYDHSSLQEANIPPEMFYTPHFTRQPVNWIEIMFFGVLIWLVSERLHKYY